MSLYAILQAKEKPLEALDPLLLSEKKPLKTVRAGLRLSSVAELVAKLRPILPDGAAGLSSNTQGKETIFVESFSVSVIHSGPCVIEQALPCSNRPTLTAARIVIAGGRAFQSAQNFRWLERLADLLDASIGGSSPLVDAGFVSEDCQIGQSGKTVAPELYIALGISGAIQHRVGMHTSQVIVAINNDADAPIFELADYYLVEDLFVVLPLFIQEILKTQGKSK